MEKQVKRQKVNNNVYHWHTSPCGKTTLYYEFACYRFSASTFTYI